MIYRAVADLVVVAHLVFILFVVLGGLLALGWRWAPWLHLPAALWGAFIEISGGVCPLTPVERSLREMAGESGYTSGFIDHYLLPIVYPPGLTREVQLALAVFVLAMNVLIYGIVWHRRARSRQG